MIDRSHYTPEECQLAADSIEQVGGVYNYIAAAIRAQNPVGSNMHYEIREGSTLVAIRETLEEADVLIKKLSFTGKSYIVKQVNQKLKYRG